MATSEAREAWVYFRSPGGREVPLPHPTTGSAGERRTVEPTRSDIQPDPTIGANPVANPGAARGGRQKPRRAPVDPRVQEQMHLRLEEPVRVRLGLQRRAPSNLRRHLARHLTRIAVLVVADLAAFWVMRGLIRAVRDQAVLGEWTASHLRSLVPLGNLSGWQFAVALLLGLFILGNYGDGDRRRDPGRLFAACALATALPLWMMIWTRGLPPVLLEYALTVVLVWLGLLVERSGIDWVIAHVRPAAGRAAEALLVGPAQECRRTMETHLFATRKNYRAVGYVDADPFPGPGALGGMKEFPTLLGASGAEVVVVCGQLSDSDFAAVANGALAAGCQLVAVPRAVEVAGVQPSVVWREGQPLVMLTALTLRSQQLAVKRAMDLAGAVAGLLLLSPVYALVAILVKLDSLGPVFFTQDRVGQGGRLFRIIKFRTMVDGAEGRRDELLSQSVYHDQRLFKVPRDPRMTRLGRWLRRTSLDELPQLVNVLRGEMSLVGPRPPLPSEVELYEAHHYGRFDVKPGITGPWQVAGRNQITDFERVVALEAHYIREWSLLRDLGILLRTVWVVLQMRGAH